MQSGAQSQSGNARFGLAGRGVGSFRRGYSQLDLLVTVGIIGVLSSLILAGLSRGRAAAQSARCLANLRSIGLGFSQYISDSEGRYPAPAVACRSWESLLYPYFSQPMIYACPADQEVFPSVGSSYDWRDTPDAWSTLAGRRAIDVTRTNAVLAFETLPGWHGKHRINAVLVNGSALVMEDDECLSDLRLSVKSAYPR